nr:pyruvate kinase alpha/beta domain-containing protein [Listeria monocytogenes]
MLKINLHLTSRKYGYDRSYRSSSWHTAKNLNVQTIVAATQSGHTARMISKYRPKSHIVAVTFNEHVYRGLALSWGVYPRLATPVSNTDEMFDLQ